jgi:hypothetical protein
LLDVPVKFSFKLRDCPCPCPNDVRRSNLKFYQTLGRGLRLLDCEDPNHVYHAAIGADREVFRNANINVVNVMGNADLAAEQRMYVVVADVHKMDGHFNKLGLEVDLQVLDCF